MKLMHILFRAAAGLILLAVLFSAAPEARAAGTVIIVNTTINSLGDSLCSFQEAIQAANQNDTWATTQDCSAGSSVETDIIQFQIDPVGTAKTITLSDGVTVLGPVYIDGTTQGSPASGPLITVTGSMFTMVYFDLGSDSSTVKGLRLVNTNALPNAEALVLMSSGNMVVGNYFNTDGTASVGNSAVGVSVHSSGNIIGGVLDADRNLFGGLVGVYISGGSNNTVRNNFFGTKPSGNEALSGLPGTLINVGSAGVLIDDGSNEASGNLIRDNVLTGSSYGIKVSSNDGPTHDNTILHNMIGLGADGATRLANGTGVALYGSYHNTMGGTTPEDRNVISGNLFGQVLVSVATTQPDNNIIQGNYIGTTANGTQALVASPTVSMYGVSVVAGTGNVVGGTAAGSGNLIAGNYEAVVIDGSTGTLVRGNLIGTDKDGLLGIPNVIGINASSAANLGDGITPGNNLIAASSNAAISINNAAAVSVVGNRLGVNAAGDPLGNNAGIEVQSGSVQLLRNWIANSTGNGIHLAVGAALTGTPVDNCLVANGDYAVFNESGVAVSFPNNWWGDVNGPGLASNMVSPDVAYTPVFTLPAAGCGPGARATPKTLAFGKQMVGTLGSKTLTLLNDGIQPLVVSDISLTGGAPYTIVGGACVATVPLSLQPGESCSVQLQFAPTSVGLAPAQSVSITSNAASSPDLVPLTGRGALGTPLLQNASFELDVNGDRKPDNWAFTNYVVGVDGRDWGYKTAGTYSLKLIGNGRQKTITQVLPMSGVAGNDFRFALSSMSNAVPAGSLYRLKVLFYNGTSLLAAPTLNFNTSSHPFQTVVGTYTAPGPYTKVVFKIIFKAASGTAWFDSAVLNWSP